MCVRAPSPMDERCRILPLACIFRFRYGEGNESTATMNCRKYSILWENAISVLPVCFCVFIFFFFSLVLILVEEKQKETK